MVIDRLRKAFFLDRDGVLIKTKIINGKPYAIKKVEELEILPKVMHSINIIKNSNYLVIVISNQPDVGNKLVDRKDVDKINRTLSKMISIDRIYVCYHSQKDNCLCRKPRIHFFNKAAKDYKIDLKKSFMVGDRNTDILAGNRAGCKTIFIDHKYSEKSPKIQNLNAESLFDAVKKANL